MGLYVEARIRAGLDELWDLTQQPSLHQRWDLRFTEIRYLPRADPDEPQRFRYATRLLPGLVVAGTGVAAGERHRADGTRTSALRFRSSHPLSLLASGSGYWRYAPGRDGIRFVTGYDYTPRWGRFGRLADHHVFRPLMGWATAWSFDRLRLWCERGLRPEVALRNAMREAALRATAVAAAVAALAAAPHLTDRLPGGGGPVALAGLAALAAAAVGCALLLPALPTTPSARRCLHRRPRHRRRTAQCPAPPRPLADLEQP